MVLSREEISEIAKKAANKVLEGQTTCVSAGMALFRDQTSFKKATPIIFRVNLRGLVSEDDLKIPHSELAMHVGAAGKDLISFALTGTQTGIATYDQGEGKCGTIFGREDELFKPALAKKVKEMWEKRGPDNPGSNPDAKEPWQMTLEEWAYASAKKYGHGPPRMDWIRAGYGTVYSSHKTAVERAIKEGKPVPPEVLADYPDLKR